MNHTFLILILLMVLYNALPAFAVQCIKRDGEFALRENGEDIEAGPFHCLRIKAKPKKNTSVVTYWKGSAEGMKCRVETVTDGGKPGTRYAKSEMPTGIYCKYKCVDDDAFKCLKNAQNGVCICDGTGPRVVTVAVVGGKGPDALGETCDDKWEGYEFADGVACTRIEGEFRKERLTEIEDGKCVKKIERLYETRYMRTEKVDRNLQGCVYVCKKNLIQCLGKEEGKVCKCGRVGLRKVLIGMNEWEVEGRVDQTRCVGNDCGPCGECVQGECLLKHGASRGNLCACGEICPEVDRRRGNKGGKIFCQPNWRLACRALPKWMLVGEPGTEEPDLCTSGKIDAADQCGCKEGYEEYLPRFGKTKCRRVE